MPVDYTYNLVAENRHSTVVAKYPPENMGKVREKRAEYYQSEAALETAFIEQLKTQAYEYLPITNEDALKTNLRTQLEKLNNFTFTPTRALPKKPPPFKRITSKTSGLKMARLKISICWINRASTITACKSSTNTPPIRANEPTAMM